MDALVLGQFSLARAAEGHSPVNGRVVLTTPDTAVTKLRACFLLETWVANLARHAMTADRQARAGSGKLPSSGSWTRAGAAWPGRRGCGSSVGRSGAPPRPLRVSTASGTWGGQPNRFVYVGQTGRTLRERLLSLAVRRQRRRSVRSTIPIPLPRTSGCCGGWTAPGSSAPALRSRATCRLSVARRTCCSGGTGSKLACRRGQLRPLLSGLCPPDEPLDRPGWKVGCPHSRPHSGRRTVPLTEGSTPYDFSVSRPALHGPADLLDAHWWQRVPLSDVRSLPAGPAVYCIYDLGAGEPVYVGETSDLPARATAHAAAPWPVRPLWLAYLALPEGTPKHVLRELESDLLGWHFWRTDRAPAAQYTLRPNAPAPL